MPHRMVTRLGEFDVRERFAPLAPSWATQIGFAIFCLGLEAIVRFMIDLFAPGTAPFALIYPAVLAATLFAGWQCGAIVLVVSELFAWYFVLAPRRTFALDSADDASRLIVVAFSAVVVIVLAEVFRRLVQNVGSVLQTQLEERDLLLREVDHRTKNNFMMVSSLVEIQRRRSSDDAVKSALSEVLTRIDSFARAHRHLYHEAHKVDSVDMCSYIAELCDALAQALTLHGPITLSHTCDEVLVDRDRAVTIGLLINELVTNAAKHAFNGRETGRIEVEFRRTDGGWRLTVADDGMGIGAGRAINGQGGLGQRLVDAFVRQANAKISTESGAQGTRVAVDFSA